MVMKRPPVDTRITTRDGARFRVTGNTLAIDLRPLALDPPAAWLLVNANNPVLLNASGEAWSVSPALAVSLVTRLNASREEPITLPHDCLRAARNLETLPDLPWPWEENEGYHNDAGETLHIHRLSGDAVLVRREMPPKLTPLQAAVWRATYTVERVGVRAALDWLKSVGFRYVPASLARRGKVESLGGDDDPPLRRR